MFVGKLYCIATYIRGNNFQTFSTHENIFTTKIANFGTCMFHLEMNFIIGTCTVSCSESNSNLLRLSRDMYVHVFTCTDAHVYLTYRRKGTFHS